MFLGCLLSDLGGAQPGARESRPPQPSAQRRGHRPGHRTSSRFQVSHCAAARTPRGSWDLDTLFHSGIGRAEGLGTKITRSPLFLVQSVHSDALLMTCFYLFFQRTESM